jgi:NADPH2:quinone reductase
MKAVGYSKPLPIDDPESLLDLELKDPTASGHDLLVEIKAVSVNPVDVKERASRGPKNEGEYRVLGFDSAGIVKGVGSEVTMLKVGDEVFYAGSYLRQGSNAQLQLVDERIVAKKPESLGFLQAASLPLTSLTAWELLFDRFSAPYGKVAKTGRILVIGAAGGVGTMLLQFARKLTSLVIIATASDPKSTDWCLQMGAHHVIDHSKPFVGQLREIGMPEVEYIASLTATDKHYPALVEVLAPEGKFGVIDDPKTLDVVPLKSKSASLHWEFMFTRSMFDTRSMISQSQILSSLAKFVDEGVVRTNSITSAGSINAANMKKAHALVESGHAHGKVVLEGF